MRMLTIQDSVAVITGGSGGLGKELARDVLAFGNGLQRRRLGGREARYVDERTDSVLRRLGKK